MKYELDFQKTLIDDLQKLFPGCYVFHGNPHAQQGVPDLIFLYKNFWAALEVKRNKNARRRPNQEWYVEDMNRLSYSAFVYPENKELVLHEIQQTLLGRGIARVP